MLFFTYKDKVVKDIVEQFEEDGIEAEFDTFDEKQVNSRRRAIRIHKKAEKIYSPLLLLFFIVLIGISTFMFLHRVVYENTYDTTFKKLKTEIIKSSPDSEESGEPADNKTKYAALLKENPDFIGWLKIEDTAVDLPVVWRQNDNSFYLSHDFDMQDSKYGVPFLDGKCDPALNSGCNNYVIYGHNMKTGTVFAGLLKYEYQDYFEQHPTIRFDSIYEDSQYDIFAAFAIDVTKDTEFQYYNDTAMDKETFNAFINDIKRRTIIRSDITPQYGDQIMTLSTCEYSTDDGRFVVFAVKKPNDSTSG